MCGVNTLIQDIMDNKIVLESARSVMRLLIAEPAKLCFVWILCVTIGLLTSGFWKLEILNLFM
jgi:hypothetical protein